MNRKKVIEAADAVFEGWMLRGSNKTIPELMADFHIEQQTTANRYALATFRALDQYTFADSDHGLLIAEAVKKLENMV